MRQHILKMYQVVNNDSWLSSELQNIYSDTKHAKTRADVARAFTNFERRLSNMHAEDYISPKIVLKNDSGCKSWTAFGRISQGELLLAEKSVCWISPRIGRRPTDYTLILWKKLLHLCGNNKKLCNDLRQLFPRTQADIRKILYESKGCKIPILEIYQFFERNQYLINRIRINEAYRLYLVVKFNQMSVYMLPELWKSPVTWQDKFVVNSLYIKSSFFDHSCRPNVVRFYIGTVAVFKALRPIHQNETLSICYIENEYISDPMWVRNSELNFFCRCNVCQREGTFAFFEDSHTISEANKESKRSNKRCSILSDGYLRMIQEMPPVERIVFIDRIMRERFLQNGIHAGNPNTPKMVSPDASKLAGFLVHDYIYVQNHDMARFWLNVMYESIQIKDEHSIPILILQAIISERRKDKIKYLTKAVRISKTVFGNNVKFFMKRYWLDIKYFSTLLIRTSRKRNLFLRRTSYMIRNIFSYEQ